MHGYNGSVAITVPMHYLGMSNTDVTVSTHNVKFQHTNHVSTHNVMI